jgi:hypothetical protein
MYSRALFAGMLLAMAACKSGFSQAAFSISPASVSFRALNAGPLGGRPTFTVKAADSTKWSVSVPQGTDWLAVQPNQGTGPATVTVRVVDWAAARMNPGKYAVTVQVNSDAGAAQLNVTLELAALGPPPKFTYISGPTGCRTSEGYPDAATCIVPGEKPPGSFSPPDPGGSYVDPNFGARVRVLTGPRSLHGYSAPSPLSANNKYALLSLNGAFSVVDASTGVRLGSIPTTEEGAIWDAADNAVFYYLAGPAVVKFNVETRHSENVVDYSQEPYRFSVIKDGSRNDSSKDNWIGFFAPNQATVCALDLNSKKTFCSKYDTAIVGIQLDASNAGVMVSKGIDRISHKRYVILNAYPTFAVFSVDEAAGKLNFESLGPEVIDFPGNGDGICDSGEKCMRGDHSDTFEDSAGRQWLLGGLESPYPCEYGAYTFALGDPKKMGVPVELGGGRKRIMPLFQCGGVDAWVDVHFGCSKATPFCVVSTTYRDYNAQFPSNLSTPIPRTAHLSEVMVIRDNGQEVRRLAQHRSVPLAGEEANSYWTTPRAAISNDASLVVADSNFGEAMMNRVILIETGFGKTGSSIPQGGADGAAPRTPGRTE